MSSSVSMCSCVTIGTLYMFLLTSLNDTFSALTLLIGRQEGHPACKKTEWWGSGMVICLELGADLYTAQLMPLPLTVSCFSKIQIGFTFLVPAHPGSPGKRAVKWVCVCVRACTSVNVSCTCLMCLCSLCSGSCDAGNSQGHTETHPALMVLCQSA